MADLESTIRTFVLARPTVTPLFADRFHWNRLPDLPTYPAIRAVTITDVPAYHMQGSTSGKTMVQLDVIDDDKVTGNTAAETLKQALSGYRGTMGAYTVRIFVKNVPSFWEPDPRYFRRVIEMEVGYVQT
jgi:hypothetical protein